MSNEEKTRMFEQALKTIETLKKAGSKATLNISLPDRIYFSIQKILQHKTKVLALAEGQEQPRRNIREELKSQELMEKTNQVSKEFAMQTVNEINEKNDEEREN